VNDGLLASSGSTTVFKDYGFDYGSGNAGGTAMLSVALTGDIFGYSFATAYKGTAGMALDHAWAYVTPIAGLSVYAGISGNNAPFGDLDNNGAGAYSTSSLGAFYSMGGFSIGAQVGQLAGGTNTDVPIWVGVHYTMDKVFQLNAYGTDGTANGLNTVNISASLQAVPNLTATVGFDMSTIATTANAFTDVQVGYTMGALGVGAIVYDRSMLAGTSYFAYQANVAYTISPQVAVSAYFAGTTATGDDYQPEVQLAWTPVAGATIKATLWYDTKAQNNGNLCGTYYGVTNTGATTSFAVDVKFAY
jgi:hypothetical protein